MTPPHDRTAAAPGWPSSGCLSASLCSLGPDLAHQVTENRGFTAARAHLIQPAHFTGKARRPGPQLAHEPLMASPERAKASLCPFPLASLLCSGLPRASTDVPCACSSRQLGTAATFTSREAVPRGSPLTLRDGFLEPGKATGPVCCYYGLNVCIPPNSCGEAHANVMAFRDGALRGN